MCSMDLMKFIVCVKIKKFISRAFTQSPLLICSLVMAVTSSWVVLSDKKSIDVLSHRFTNDLQWLNVMTIPPNFQTIVTTVTYHEAPNIPDAKSSATIKHQVFCHVCF